MNNFELMEEVISAGRDILSDFDAFGEVLQLDDDMEYGPTTAIERLRTSIINQGKIMKVKNYNWQLTNVDDQEYIPDRSGVYCLINWQVQADTVRIDFMSDNHDPIISFAGSAENVRKAVGVWIDSRISQVTSDKISAAHIAYIGSELQKADIFRIDYIQDGDCQKTIDPTSDKVCSKCGYSKCGYSSDNILMCLDCGETWPTA